MMIHALLIWMLWQSNSQKLNAHPPVTQSKPSQAQHGGDKQSAIWHDCKWKGNFGNFAGYQTAAETYECKEGTVRLEGRWSESIQNGWQYHTTLGRLDGMGPSYVGDLPLSEQMPSFQKWCKTKYGYELCGWNDEEEARQRALQKTRKAPPMKR